MIAGLINSDSGKILIDGKDITNKSVSDRASMGLAYLPQEPSVFGRLSVEENIMAALEPVSNTHLTLPTKTIV